MQMNCFDGIRKVLRPSICIFAQENDLKLLFHAIYKNVFHLSLHLEAKFISEIQNFHQISIFFERLASRSKLDLSETAFISAHRQLIDPNGSYSSHLIQLKNVKSCNYKQMVALQ